MTSWSPFDRKRKKEPARSRGRHRQHLLPAAGKPGAVLTDRDAAQAAEAARQNRTAAQAPAWERFGSQPVSPVRHPPEDGDVTHRLAEAQRDHAGRVVPADTRRRDSLLKAGARGDYGTGPAYDISSMN